MSLTLVVVLAITLGFPVLAIIALASTGAFSPDLLSTFLVGGVVVAFVVGAIFEIRRMADLDRHDAPEEAEQPVREAPPEKPVQEAPLGARVYEAAPLPVASGADETRHRAEPLPDQEMSTETPRGSAATAEPVTVEPVEQASSGPIVAESLPEAKAGTPPGASVLVTEAPPADRVKRKGGKRAPVAQETDPNGATPDQPMPVAKSKRKGSQPKRPGRT
jgi:hypothetical protein